MNQTARWISRPAEDGEHAAEVEVAVLDEARGEHARRPGSTKKTPSTARGISADAARAGEPSGSRAVTG